MIKGSFPISKVLVFEGNSYVCWKNEDIRHMVKNVIKGFFLLKVIAMLMKILTILWLQMVKNVIKGSFPISKVLVFEGNSYVCWKNEDIRLFYDCKW